MTCDCADRQAIVDMLNRYASCLDGHDWPGLNDVFDIEATAEYGVAFAGRPAIVQAISALLDDCGPSQHLLGNYQIRINGDEAEATTKVRVIHIGAGERAALTPYESIGVYEDLLRRTPEGWRIVHRRFDVQISIGDIAILGLNLS